MTKNQWKIWRYQEKIQACSEQSLLTSHQQNSVTLFNPVQQQNFPVEPIGKVVAPFTEKFAVPRQSNLTPSVLSQIIIHPPYGVPEAFAGIEEFSHIWLLFRFHQNLEQGWRAQVRPPRLGGNKKRGVFATRSSFRPNGFGMSVVPLISVESDAQQVVLNVSGLDLVNDTPVYDIKPYIPYADALPEARGGFADERPATLAVCVTPAAAQQLQQLSNNASALTQQVIEVLAQDPRPAYRKLADQDTNHYGTHFGGFNFRWHVQGDTIEIFEIRPL